MKNLQKGFVAPLLIAIIAVLVIGGGVYIYSNKKVEAPILPTGTEVQTTTQVQQNVPKSDQAMIQATTTYIDSDGVVNTVSCGSKNCFESYFTSCSPATLLADTGEFGAVEYKIVGKSKTGCSLTFKYTKYSDSTWVNKDMTCPFDNKISFKDSLTKVFQGVTTGAVVCTGPLYSILYPH